MIAAGHSLADVMTYTPRQAAAFVHFAGRRRRRELADLAGIVRIATGAKDSDFKRAIEGLNPK